MQEASGTGYGSFQDDTKQRWSVQFPSKETSERFAMHVAVATFLSGPRTEAFILEVKEGQQEVSKETVADHTTI